MATKNDTTEAIADARLITPLETARIMKSVFNDTADQIAQGLKAAYPDLTAYDIGVILLDAQVYPDLTRSQMQDALSGAGFSQADVADALARLYQQDVPERHISMYQGAVKLTLAVSDESIAWSFPLVYELQTFPAKYATVYIDNTPQELYPGIQTIQGTGKTVILSWAIQKNNSVKIGSNPFNISSRDGYPLKDIILSDTEASLDVMAVSQAVQWNLDATIIFDTGTSAQIQLITDGNGGPVLQTGSNQLNFQASTVSFYIFNYKGSGLVRIAYKLRQSQ